MPYNGNGVFNRVHDWTRDKANAIKINASRMDEEFDGVAGGLSTAVTRDGQTTVTADLPMNGHRHTRIGDAEARSQYASAAQVQDGTLAFGADDGAKNAYAVTVSPALAAYAAGQRLRFVPTANNTGAATLSVSGLASKPVKKAVGSGVLADLDEDDLDAATVATVVYAGAHFQLLNPQSGLPYILGQKLQSFLLLIEHSGGVLKHRFQPHSGSGGPGRMYDRIAGTSTEKLETPTGPDATTSMVGGAKFSTTYRNHVILDTADQEATHQNAVVSLSVAFDRTNNGLRAQVYFLRSLVGGSLRRRPHLALVDSRGQNFHLNKTNIGSGKKIGIAAIMFIA